MILRWIAWVALATIGILVLGTILWRLQDQRLERRDAAHRAARRHAEGAPDVEDHDTDS